MSPETPTLPRARTLSQRTDSLNDVRAVIPGSCYERSPARAVWALVQAVALYVAPIVGLALTDRWWALLVLWPWPGSAWRGCSCSDTMPRTARSLDSRRLNRVIAQLCMAPSAHVEAAWDLGHNRIHHGYTTRQGFDFVWHPATLDEYKAMGGLGRLRHRFEWSCARLGRLLLAHRVVGEDVALQRPGQATWGDRARQDHARSLLIIVVARDGGDRGAQRRLVAADLAAVKLFVVPFLLFVHIIGWTVYVHHVSPEIRWWTRRDWSQFKGQMESTTILRTPRLMNRLWFHNIFIHVPHHVDARIRFDKLPKAARAIAAAYPKTVHSSRLSIRQYLRTTRACKLYDFEAGRWLSYAAARSLTGNGQPNRPVTYASVRSSDGLENIFGVRPNSTSTPVRRSPSVDTSVVKNADPVADARGLLHVVGDDHDRVARLDLLHEILDPRRGDRIECRARFVHQDHVGLHGEGPGDAQALLLPARQTECR